MELSELSGKRILIVGMAKTGVTLARLLTKHGAQVTISDHKSKAELSGHLEKLEGMNVTLELGGHTPKTFLSQDLIVLSPGVPPHLKIFDYARSQGVTVTGELEFCSQFITEPIIAITGTNGKTTTSHLIYTFLAESGVKTWIGGNFGEPLSDYLMRDERCDVLVLEVSSFMLEHVQNFKPSNIVFTNLAENHLDRYRTMEEYVNAKRKIFLKTNGKTTSILNADDNAVVELARDPMVQQGRIFYFSRKPILEPQIMEIGGAVTIKNQVRMRTHSRPEIEYYNLENAKMRGRHSHENIMAAILAAREHGAHHEVIQRVIENYSGMPHRLEYVRKVGGVNFYNDSKATNVHAVLRALDSFDENIILIMGGKDTNLNYAPLKDKIQRKVKTLILVGEAKERINRDIGDYSETFLIGTFEEAVLISYQKSRINDTVLLSPGASSHDMFDSYVERGNYFKEIINKFK
jgi:UDP-N-acetylmuramoylalanine--D-glutamate ligase